MEYFVEFSGLKSRKDKQNFDFRKTSLTAIEIPKRKRVDPQVR